MNLRRFAWEIWTFIQLPFKRKINTLWRWCCVEVQLGFYILCCRVASGHAATFKTRLALSASEAELSKRNALHPRAINILCPRMHLTMFWRLRNSSVYKSVRIEWHAVEESCIRAGAAPILQCNIPSAVDNLNFWLFRPEYLTWTAYFGASSQA